MNDHFSNSDGSTNSAFTPVKGIHMNDFYKQQQQGTDKNKKGSEDGDTFSDWQIVNSDSPNS